MKFLRGFIILSFFIFFSFLSYGCIAHADTTSNLIDWWKFDDGSGTTAIDSGSNGFTGTLNGIVPPTWVSGQVGGALSFNGTNGSDDSVSINHNPFGSGAATVCAWIDPTDWGGSDFARIIDTDTNTNVVFFIAQSNVSTDTIEFSNTGSGAPVRVIAPSYSITLGSWQHVCGTRDNTGTFGSIYVNGLLVATGTMATASTGTTSLYIGNRSDNARAFDGLIDDVRIYSRDLSAQDIDDIYNDVVPPTVTVQAASAITLTSATLNGTVVSTGSSTVTNEGFNYGTSTAYGAVVSSTGSFAAGTFNQTIATLSCGTTYYYQAFVTNVEGTGTSTPQTFSTTNCATTSTPPQSLGATAGDTQVALSWSAPALNGGSNLTQYLVYDRFTGSGTFTLYATTTFSQTNETASSLTDGQSYDFEVLAQNGIGTSTASNIVSATPVAPPVVVQSGPVVSVAGSYGSPYVPDQGFIDSSTEIAAPSSSSSSLALSSSPSSSTLSSLEVQLDGLLAAFTQLQTEARAKAPLFTRDLELGMSGKDVNELQQFLVAQDDGPAAWALAQHGTTDLFGSLTQAALIEFQKKNAISPAIGYFGPKTRAWVGGH